MLVVSRKPKQRVLLPGLGIAVQVVAIKPGAVRLGIEAPPEVAVLREELRDRAAEGRPAEARPREPSAGEGLFHRRLRDRLRDTAVALGLLQLQLRAGAVPDAEAALARLRDDFQLLRLGVEGELEPPAPGPAPAPPPRKAARALLVEDDGNQRELLAGFLRLSGLEVDTAGDGHDALDRLRAGARPDVVLLDMGLPRCDGPTTVRAIRGDPAYAGLKIVAVSGHRPEEYDLAAGPAGIDRWFHKPVDPATLVRDLAEELGGHLCGA